MGRWTDEQPASRGRHDYEPSAALCFFIQQKQRELAAMPERLRGETIERARRCAKPGSYLAKHFAQIYGEKL